MLYLILSILCSVSVGVIFKAAPQKAVRTPQIIFFNYAIALLLCFIFFEPQPSVTHFTEHWYIYTPLMILLPSIFLFMAASIKHVGIVRTDAAQRLSLFIPILAAWLLFGEAFNTYKILGLAIGLPALLLILYKRPDTENTAGWQYPAMVFLGFGIADVLFKQVALFKAPIYTTSLFMVFLGALTVAFFAVVYELIILKKNVSVLNLAYGALVGIFNFGNILFYIKAHKEFSDNPSTVFAAMNMGVIVIGSLVGVIKFNEKLSLKNYLGLALALMAIILVALSQIYSK